MEDDFEVAVFCAEEASETVSFGVGSDSSSEKYNWVSDISS